MLKCVKFPTPRRLCPLSPLLDLATLTTGRYISDVGRPKLRRYIRRRCAVQCSLVRTTTLKAMRSEACIQ